MPSPYLIRERDKLNLPNRDYRALEDEFARAYDWPEPQEEPRPSRYSGIVILVVSIGVWTGIVSFVAWAVW